MAWIDAHPASLADTGLLEPLEELITFYLLKNHSQDAAAQAYYHSMFKFLVLDFAKHRHLNGLT